ncbi:hypothetical protein ACN47E_006099 [Coniothyrium glycines]
METIDPDQGVTASSDASASCPQFQLRAATYADIPAIARLWKAAFFDDEIIGHLMHPYREEYPEDLYWFLLRGNREQYWNQRHQFVVVTVNEDGRNEHLIGAANWRRLGEGGENRELAAWDPRSLIAHIIRRYHGVSLKFFPNRAADPAQTAWLDDAVEASEQYWTGDRAECWDLHVCGVHPDYQGQGVGRLLAEWGVKEAQKEGDHVVASVLCGEKNRGFYGKAGLSVEVHKGEQGLALFSR